MRAIVGLILLWSGFSSAILHAQELSTDTRQPAQTRHPGPVMDAGTIRAGLASHDKALYVKFGWIRDPYVVLGPDDNFSLTGTTLNPGNPRQESDPHNIGLWDTSIVGWKMQVWRSKDLVEWEPLSTPFIAECRESNSRKSNHRIRSAVLGFVKLG